MRLTTLIFIFWTSMVISQDTQWYVKDGKNITNTVLSPSVYYELYNVKHPLVSTSNQDAKNDVFIIYADGTYFNSREIIGFSQTGGQGVGYLLKGKPTGERIEYMYFTNKYEEDDFPPTANIVHVGNSSGYALLGVNSNPTSELLSANHDIVPGKDITVIVNNKMLNDGCSYKLCYNQNDENNPYSDILTPRNVFKVPGTQVSSFTYPVQYPVGNNDCIDFTVDSSIPYLFFNFNCKVNVHVSMFEAQSNFSLTSSGKECSGGAILKEDVNHAHDPNFVEVKRICQFQKDTFVTYHIEFFNDDNSAAANNLVVENIVLPDILDDNCIGVTSWAAGNVNHNNSTYDMVPKIENGKLSFKFKANSNHMLNPYNPSKHKASVGFVEFCVKVKKGYSVLNYKHSLRLGVPRTKFGEATYPITDYYDLSCDSAALGIEPDDCRRPILLNEPCGCFCGVVERKKRCWLWNLFRKKS